VPTQKWERRLREELSHRQHFAELDRAGWRKLLSRTRVTSDNYDTVLSIDWPHFCAGATDGCGGAGGWCYTLHGNQASQSHDAKVAMVDLAARRCPDLLASKVVSEVRAAVTRGALAYRNLRYSASGEVASAHIPALRLIADQGVRLWGYTRQVRIGVLLRSVGAAVLFSCDRSTSPATIEEARREGLGLAYTSLGVTDVPPSGRVVTFPLHRAGRVREVVDDPALCPKVVDEYLHESRNKAWCQARCVRCHLVATP
jgi:hypothetical protein